MLRARQKVMARWVKSRHTPVRVSRTSTAVLSGLVDPYPNATSWWTQSHTAWTRDQPGGSEPNSDHAASVSWSDRQ